MHVIQQCAALFNELESLTVCLNAKQRNLEEMRSTVLAEFGVDIHGWHIVSTNRKSDKGLALFIALRAISQILKSRIKKETIYSRNLYASFFLSLFYRGVHFFEAHLIESGFRQILFKRIIESKNVGVVCISSGLKRDISTKYKLKGKLIQVLHDGAPSKDIRLSKSEKLERRKTHLPKENCKYDNIVGYVGSLHRGRGIEIIGKLAIRMPNIFFVIIGGNEPQIKASQNEWRSENLYFMGHLKHQDAYHLMPAFDLLLMPYQKIVSIGTKEDFTQRWMSPLKLFEYMSAGVPIISSNISVLTEILQQDVNAILVEPDDIEGWESAIKRVFSMPDFASKLSDQAFEDLQRSYTWQKRARNIQGLLQ